MPRRADPLLPKQQQQHGGDGGTLIYQDGFVHVQANQWSQGLCADVPTGCLYQFCCCCYGHSAVLAVSEHVNGLNTDTLNGPGECYQDCGCDVSSYCCWVFCGTIVVRTARAKLRAKYNLTGGCCEDYILADNCPGCALEQARAHVAAVDSGLWQPSKSGPVVLRLER
jgi:Cys-rich protein (TIGR01571 family)